MAKTKEERLHEVHARAMKQFDKIQTALRDERLQCLQDRRFYSLAGAQWEGPLGQQFENKPRLEVNKIHLAVIRIINEYRNNRISVNFISKDGSENEDLADTCASLYRATEQDSMAEEAYDNAFEEAVGGGFGAFRLRADYEDEEDEEDERQKICIEPIFDADSSVFFDLDAKRQDKADARFAYILSSMTRQGYIDEYGVDPTSWSKQIFQRQFDWLTPDVVYVAEYFEIEKKKSEIVTFTGINGDEEKYNQEELDEDEDIVNSLTARGFKETSRKKIKVKKVHKYIMDGERVIEDCGYIAGKNIPIVPVYGKRWFIDNVERCMGHVRLAKDQQRIKNMQISKLAEISAVSSVEKPIFTPEQVAGHQQIWADDNIKNYPYLLVNQLTDLNGNAVAVGPQAYTRSPTVPPAMVALLQLTEQDMQDVLGNQQAGEQIQPNISGKAIELIQNRLDMQSFIYISNLAKAIKRSGEIWLSMAKDIFVEEGRKVKGISENGEVASIELMRPNIAKTGEAIYENDLSKADFDVAVDVGPSSASKKQSVVRSLTGMMQLTQDPQDMKVLSAMAMMNMEGEGLKDTRKYYRKQLLQLGAVEPTEEEQQELMQAAQNQQPDPQALFLTASAKQADAMATKAHSDSLLSIAKSKESEAKIAEIFSKISAKDKELILKAFETLGGEKPQETVPIPPTVG